MQLKSAPGVRRALGPGDGRACAVFLRQGARPLAVAPLRSWALWPRPLPAAGTKGKARGWELAAPRAAQELPRPPPWPTQEPKTFPAAEKRRAKLPLQTKPAPKGGRGTLLLSLPEPARFLRLPSAGSFSRHHERLPSKDPAPPGMELPLQKIVISGAFFFSFEYQEPGVLLSRAVKHKGWLLSSDIVLVPEVR